MSKEILLLALLDPVILGQLVPTGLCSVVGDIPAGPSQKLFPSSVLCMRMVLNGIISKISMPCLWQRHPMPSVPRGNNRILINHGKLSYLVSGPSVIGQGDGVRGISS